MLGVHLQGRVRARDADGPGGEERRARVVCEGLVVLVEAEEGGELVELDGFFAKKRMELGFLNIRLFFYKKKW
jgi:hypothetical protein